MLFHFEYLHQGRWETVGSGEGAEEKGALIELIGLAGGSLPAGTYRAIAARSPSIRWESLVLAEDGTVSLAETMPAALVR